MDCLQSRVLSFYILQRNRFAQRVLQQFQRRLDALRGKRYFLFLVFFAALRDGIYVFISFPIHGECFGTAVRTERYFPVDIGYGKGGGALYWSRQTCFLPIGFAQSVLRFSSWAAGSAPPYNHCCSHPMPIQTPALFPASWKP